MNNVENEFLESHFLELAISLDVIASLSNILLDCIRGGENLKPKDIENLALALFEKVNETQIIFNQVETKCLF